MCDRTFPDLVTVPSKIYLYFGNIIVVTKRMHQFRDLFFLPFNTETTDYLRRSMVLCVRKTTGVLDSGVVLGTYPFGRDTVRIYGRPFLDQVYSYKIFEVGIVLPRPREVGVRPVR